MSKKFYIIVAIISFLAAFAVHVITKKDIEDVFEEEVEVETSSEEQVVSDYLRGMIYEPDPNPHDEFFVH